MIVDNSYFRGSIYIPESKPGISGDAANIDSQLLEFIEEYSREAIIKCLGYKLGLELISNLDDSRENKLKETADPKWDALVNGETYIDPNGDEVVWLGIRFKNIESGDYNRSLLAYYIYYYYEEYSYITRSNIGNVQEDGDGSTKVSSSPKLTKAWNKFVSLTQGDTIKARVINKGYGYGVDYMPGGVQDISLYRYIKDKNNLIDNTFSGFSPQIFEKINQFGI